MTLLPTSWRKYTFLKRQHLLLKETQVKKSFHEVNNRNKFENMEKIVIIVISFHPAIEILQFPSNYIKERMKLISVCYFLRKHNILSRFSVNAIVKKFHYQQLSTQNIDY